MNATHTQKAPHSSLLPQKHLEHFTTLTNDFLKMEANTAQAVLIKIFTKLLFEIITVKTDKATTEINRRSLCIDLLSDIQDEFNLVIGSSKLDG